LQRLSLQLPNNTLIDRVHRVTRVAAKGLCKLLRVTQRAYNSIPLRRVMTFEHVRLKYEFVSKFVSEFVWEFILV